MNSAYDLAKMSANGLCHDAGTPCFLTFALKSPNKIFMRYSIYRPNIVTQILHGFIQTLQAEAVHDYFCPNTLIFITHSSSLSFSVI
jgi:hypothetical protein